MSFLIDQGFFGFFYCFLTRKHTSQKPWKDPEELLLTLDAGHF